MSNEISNHGTAKQSTVKNPIMYALSHARGYADIFDWTEPDREHAKQIKEQCITDDFVRAYYHDFYPHVRIESCEPPLPDCQVIDRTGKKVGVEVTELVDRHAIELNKKNCHCYREYSSDAFLSAVEKLLEVKNQKLRVARAEIRCASFESIVVVIHSDEPDLIQRVPFCREVFSSYAFGPFSELDEAYLLLPCPRKKHLYDNEAEFDQLIQIPLQKLDVHTDSASA